MTAEVTQSGVVADPGSLVPAPRGASWPGTTDLVELVPGRRAVASLAGPALPPVVAVAVAALVAVAAGAGPLVTLVVLGTWALHHLVTELGARARCVAAGRTWTLLARRTAWPVAVAGTCVAVGWLPATGLASAVVASAAATAALVVAAPLVGGRRRPRRVLVVGDPTPARELVRHWSDRSDVEVLGHYPYDAAPGLARRLSADAVVVAPSREVDADAVRSLEWALEDSRTAVVLAPALTAQAPHRLTAGSLGGRSLVEVAPSRPPLAVRFAKAALDRVGAAVLLLLLSPVLLALLALVRLDSPGNPVFTQTRVGRGGRPFRVFKIRTMGTDAEGCKEGLAELDEGNGVLFKVHGDPRVTRVGRFLRRSSLDELPQLLNVLRGEMSLVGPRPALPQEVAAYDDLALRRLAVRPGMTGLWQVSGRSDLDWETSVALDVAYTDNVSIPEDLRICARTLGAVVGGHGAY